MVETGECRDVQVITGGGLEKVGIKKVAHTRLPSVGFRSWSRFLTVSPQMTWVINPAVGCHYFPPGLQLPPQPLRGLLSIFAALWTEAQWVWTVCLSLYPTASRLRFEPGSCAWVYRATPGWNSSPYCGVVIDSKTAITVNECCVTYEQIPTTDMSIIISLRLIKAPTDNRYGNHNYTDTSCNQSVFSFLRQLSTWNCSNSLLSAVLRRHCCWVSGGRRCRSISRVGTALSSKPAAAAWEWRDTGTGPFVNHSRHILLFYMFIVYLYPCAAHCAY